MRDGVKLMFFVFWGGGGEGSILILNCVADTSSLYDVLLLYMTSLLRGFIILKYCFSNKAIYLGLRPLYTNCKFSRMRGGGLIHTPGVISVHKSSISFLCIKIENNF